MMHGWGVMRSVSEIESVIGEGPFVLRHVRDVSRGHERGVCALCGRGLGMTFVFWAGPKGERQIELGAECAKTLPGSISRKIKETKSEIAAAKKAGRQPALAPIEPGIHMWDHATRWVCSHNGVEYSVERGSEGFRFTRLQTRASVTVRVPGNVRCSSINEMETFIQGWLDNPTI